MTVMREELGDATGCEALAPTAATGITASVRHPTSGLYTGMDAKAALFTVETNPIRFRIDGTAASATVGHKVDSGQNITITGIDNVKNFSCMDTVIGASAVTVTVFF